MRMHSTLMSRLTMGLALLFISISVGASRANTILVEDVLGNDLGFLASSDVAVQFLGFVGAAPTGPLATSATNATGFVLANSGVATEATTLNAIAGTSFIGSDVTQRDVGQVPDLTSIDITAGYFSFKVGRYTAFFQNLLNSPLVLNLEYDEIGGNPGSGFSHLSEYGLTPVPLPAALPLFGGALGLIGLLGWRRKRIAAT